MSLDSDKYILFRLISFAATLFGSNSLQTLKNQGRMLIFARSLSIIHMLKSLMALMY
jgi:hypothetical protein